MRGVKKIIGLMFKRRLSEERAWIFELKELSKREAGVHTFFCFSEILVVWLDRERKVVDLEVLKPFSIKFPKQKAKWIIELNPKLRDLISLGDELVFPPVPNQGPFQKSAK